MKRDLIELFFIFLVIIFSLPAISPFFHQGFFPMHDDTQPSRVFEMAKSLSFGQFPVRWVDDLGYGFGYPIFNFYAPLPYYIGAIFYLLGFSAINATKIMFIFGIIAAGIGFYLLASEIAGKIAGVTSALFYMYAPYHAVNIYVRGAVGEFYAYAFLPFLLWGMCLLYKATEKNKSVHKGFLIISITTAIILISHNILSLIFFYFTGLFIVITIIYFLSHKTSFNFLKFYILATLLGIGLAAFFIIPAFAEKSYTKVSSLTTDGSDYHLHFVYLDQLWNSTWGYGGSAGRHSGMSFKIGKVHLIWAFLSLMGLLIMVKIKKIRRNKLLYFFFLVMTFFLISLFLTLRESLFVWQNLPFFPFIQYPWRFLNYCLLFLSILSAAFFIPLSKFWRILFSLIIIILIFWFNLKYFVPQYYNSSTDLDYISIQALESKISKISDEYMPPDFDTSAISSTAKSLVIIPNDKPQIFKTIIDQPTYKSYLIHSLSDHNLYQSHIAYFPGWQVNLNGQDIDSFDRGGRLAFFIPLGQSSVTIKLTDSPIRSVSNSISLLSLFLLVYVSLFSSPTKIWLRKNIQWK